MINTNFIQKNFPKGKLTVVLGRPATGKTSMAVSLAYELARDGHHPIYFSMEMSKEMLAQRLVAQMGTEVPTDIWGNIHVNDTPSLKVSDIRKIVADQNIDFIIIDYLQLMTRDGCSSREEEQEQIKNELKALASELDIPVVLLSQMSKAQEEELKQKLVVITEEWGLTNFDVHRKVSGIVRAKVREEVRKEIEEQINENGTRFYKTL